MGIFSKNANEAAYVGGKKHWTDVIKNTGAGEYLIWRQPEEDFNTNSSLVVMPGEAAIFVDRGQIVQTFENGTYQLTTENYPFISRLRNAFSGGVSKYNCVVYFVRKAVSKELLWGTSSRIQVRDKVWNIRTDIGARGAFKIKVENPGVFLEKMLGNNVTYQTQAEIFDYFGEELQSKIVSILASFFNYQWQTELIGLEACLMDLSAFLKPQVDEMLKEYGFKCESFVISGLMLDTSKYDSMDEAQIQKNKMQLLGEDWAKLTAAEILHALAENPGAGGVAATGAGIGMGVAAGGVFTGLANQLFSSLPGNNAAVQPSYTPPDPNRFQQLGPNMTQNGPATPSMGTLFQQNTPSQPVQGQGASDSDDPMQVLSKLKKMLDLGLISKEMYDEKVREVLSRM